MEVTQEMKSKLISIIYESFSKEMAVIDGKE
jgi:hypothetical protein